jgi:outer membrane immunogenic protein
MRQSLLASFAVLDALSVTAGHAADLPSKKSTPQAPAVSAPWTGFYMGVNGGYSFQNNHKVTDNADGSTVKFNGASGYVVGGQVGYDHQIQSFVLGLASDLDYSGVKKTFHPAGSSANYRATVSSDYVGTLRARFGYLFTNDLLAYVTGGGALSHMKLKDTETGAQSKTFYGYVVGAGLEYRFTKNISSFTEYRYYSFQEKNLSVFGVKTKPDNSEIRIGVNYRF